MIVERRDEDRKVDKLKNLKTGQAFFWSNGGAPAYLAGLRIKIQTWPNTQVYVVNPNDNSIFEPKDSDMEADVFPVEHKIVWWDE